MKNVNLENLKTIESASAYKMAIGRDSAHISKARGIVIVKDYKFAKGAKDTIVVFAKRSNDAKEGFKAFKNDYGTNKLAYGKCQLVKGADGKPELQINILDGSLPADSIAQEAGAAFAKLGVTPKTGNFDIKEEEEEEKAPSGKPEKTASEKPAVNPQALADELKAQLKTVSDAFASIKTGGSSPETLSNAKGILETFFKAFDAVPDVIKTAFQSYADSFRKQYEQIVSALGVQKTSAPVANLSAAVGDGCPNKLEDVKAVQTLLNKFGYGLTVDGDCGKKSIAAIKDFQTKKVGLATPDGKIDLGGKTWKALQGGGSTPNTNAPSDTPATTSSISASVGKGGSNKLEDVKVVQALLNKHGFGLVVDGDCGNKTITAIAKFQQTKMGMGSPDGKIDPGGNTWKALSGTGTVTPPQDNANNNPAPTGPLAKPNWVSIAESEIGVKEVVGKQHNPRVLEYHATTGKFSDDETPWCASFVNWVMQKAGQGGTGSAVALSWKKYGKNLGKPAYGSIAVFSWGGGKGHVGFVVGKQGSNILVLGGNQSNAVNIAKFDPKKAVAFVVPANYEVPANAYTFGESTGDFGGDSDIANTR